MRIKIYWIIVLAAVGALLSGCKKDDTGKCCVPVMSVALDQTILALEVNGTSTLVATIVPEDAANQQVRWSSGNESIAKVNNGVVSGVAVGKTTITVTTVDGNYTASCDVTVVADVEEYIKTLLLDAFSKMGVDAATFTSWGWTMDTPLNDWDYIDYAEVGTAPQLEINLAFVNLNGTICPELCQIPGITVLDLNNNNLTGPIPAEIGNLTQLRELVLYGNRFTGKLPETLGNLKNLEYLDLDGNSTFDEQPFPLWLCNLTSLEEVWLNDCNLTGTIPAELGNLTRLEYLNLKDNLLAGTVPASLKANPYYMDFELNPQQDGYGITDAAPGDADKAVLLAIKSAWGTEAPDPIQSTWTEENLLREFYGVSVNGLGYVVKLDLDDIGISSLPDLSDLKELTRLNLRRNNLTGPIPDWIGNLTQLRELILYDNQFTGKIPETLGNLKNLEYLDLDGTSTLDEQPFPLWLCNLTSLEEVWLNDCNLTGTIPAELGNLTRLEYLNLQHNQLSGPIPETVLNHPYFDEWVLTPQNSGYGFDN